MIPINISGSGKQQIAVPFSQGTATISLWYSFICSSWFMNVSYGNHQVNGILVEYGVNLTYVFRHMFPFGIMCITDSMVRPVYLDSFKTGESALFLLDGSENIKL